MAPTKLVACARPVNWVARCADACGMNTNPAADETPSVLEEIVSASKLAAVVEPAPDPLAGFAVDANELIGRIHAGEGHDVSSLVARSLSERAA